MKKNVQSLTKVLFLVVLSLSLFVFNSCDEDDGPSIDEVIGIWSLYEIEADDGTITPFAQLGKTLVITFTADTYSSVETRTGENPEYFSGTWVRINSTTISLTQTGTTNAMSLTKEGVYYVYYDSYSGYMKFKKQ